MKNKMKRNLWTLLLQRAIIIRKEKLSPPPGEQSFPFSLSEQVSTWICSLCLTELKWRMEQNFFLPILISEKGKTSEFDQNN